MLKRIADWLLLTRTERNVILFLVVTMLAGAGVRLYQAMFPSALKFDYRASDSTFASFSTAVEDSSSVINEELVREKSGRININTATKQELMDLPGIGDVTAERIIKYRKEAGRFYTAEDLRAVKGISKMKLEKLKPLITTQ